MNAVARSHKVPVSILPCDWKKLVMEICESKLPSQSCHEAFEEKLQNGSLEAEGLTHVISVQKAGRWVLSRT